MRRLTFSSSEQETLHYERFHHPHPRVQQRMEIVWLKSHNVPHAQIATLAGVCENTVRTVLDLYLDGGIEALCHFDFETNGSPNEMDQYASTLQGEFARHPPATIGEAAARIKELTGLERSVDAVGNWLKKQGLSRRKVGSVPAKADADKQEEFKKKT